MPSWSHARALPKNYWVVFTRRSVSAVVWSLSLTFAWWFMFSDFTTQLAHAFAVALPLIFLFAVALILLIGRASARRLRRQE